MSIFTTPIFYYGFTVTTNQRFLNFDEGNGELTATVRPSGYSFTELANAVASAMNSIGTQLYTVVANRNDRTFTISAPAPFDLLFGTGANSGLSVASVIGFDFTDKLADTSYTSDFQAGSQFIPQFLPQNFVDFDDIEEFAESNVNESASGVTEVYSIGIRRFMEFNLTPITDNPIIGFDRTNPNAVSEAREFLRFAITKGNLEIMRDESDRGSFSVIKLERTPTSSNGTGFRLRELYGRNLVGYFETGLLRFREVTL